MFSIFCEGNETSETRLRKFKGPYPDQNYLKIGDFILAF